MRDALEAQICREAAAVCDADDAAALRALVDQLRCSSTPAACDADGRALRRRLAAMTSNQTLRVLYLDLLDCLGDEHGSAAHAGDFDAARAQAIDHELAEAVIAGEPARLAAAVAATRNA